MASFHVSESDAVRDFAGLLARVRLGEEVAIESDAQPVALLQPAQPKRRRTAEQVLCIAKMLQEQRGFAAMMDEDFASDMREIVAARQVGPRRSSWDSY